MSIDITSWNVIQFMVIFVGVFRYDSHIHLH